MANINANLQMRQDTAANMANVVLFNGEMGYTTDTKVMKIGDGVTAFSNISQINLGTISTILFSKVTGRCSTLFLYSSSTHLPSATYYIDTASRG